jgi:hypothetical protein
MVMKISVAPVSIPAAGPHHGERGVVAVLVVFPALSHLGSAPCRQPTARVAQKRALF